MRLVLWRSRAGGEQCVWSRGCHVLRRGEVWRSKVWRLNICLWVVCAFLRLVGPMIFFCHMLYHMLEESEVGQGRGTNLHLLANRWSVLS